jgi:Protein of unknown function (DUF3592)
MLQRVLAVFAVLLVAAAVACFGAGVWIRREMSLWMEGTQHTTGVVEDMVAAKAIGADGYAAQVVFVADNKEVRFTSAPATVHHVKKGETVDVLYHPSDPTNAGIEHERQPSWFVPLFFMGTAMFLLLVAVLTGLVARGVVGLSVSVSPSEQPPSAL